MDKFSQNLVLAPWQMRFTAAESLVSINEALQGFICRYTRRNRAVSGGDAHPIYSNRPTPMVQSLGQSGNARCVAQFVLIVRR